MKTKRTGDDPIYDENYVRLKNESQILGGGSRMPTAYSILWTKQNLEVRRLEYVGDDEGEYQRNGKVFVAIIPLLNKMLEGINGEYEHYQQKKLREGYRLPEEMPEEISNKKSVLEARLDIALEELAKIEERLKTFEGKDEELSAELVLKYGLEGLGRLYSGELVELDGQSCDVVNGLVCICDNRSPYNGMSTADYYDLSAKWKSEIKASDSIHLKKLQEKAKEAGEALPRSYNSRAAGMAIKKDRLPPWPKGIINHLKQQEATTS